MSPKSAADCFVAWPGIEGLQHVRKRAAKWSSKIKGEGEKVTDENEDSSEQHTPKITLPKIRYKAKIKLDGTNSGIVIEQGSFACQSRNRILRPGLSIRDPQDNCGFALWAEKNRDYMEKLSQDGSPLVGTTIFGEWLGKGIPVGHNSVTRKIDRPIFAVFAIVDRKLEEKDAAACFKIEFRPEAIKALLPDHPDIFIVEWFDPVAPQNTASSQNTFEGKWEFVFDFGDEGLLHEEADRVNKIVEEIENEDPWVKRHFDISGVGEGLVLYPVGFNDAPEPSHLALDQFARYGFKAKGYLHRVSKAAAAVSTEVVNLESVKHFAATFVTPQRVAQGINEVQAFPPFSNRDLKDLVPWILRDVKKESVEELETSGLAWDQVKKEVAAEAKRIFEGMLERE